MKINVFRRRPYSAMVHLTQDEAWKLITSLVLQMQKNDQNTERMEMIDAGGQYFSIAVEPDPIRWLTGSDRRALIQGFPNLIKHLKSIKGEGADFTEALVNAYGKEIEQALEKLSEITAVEDKIK